ncbi:alpha-D-GlcNAc-pyrophosphate polyprenol, alpha-3-L-rhamnosyltransferase domain protein [Mycobacterium xenopi 4042]|uniref:Alpha-D-GlcNAc-pyrophosphate polyprenol, alpha-3-L-rhamnosyltransferase domain protein n=1 Tax=Mycobacterium xenopi 4042 TaxID=1299334 RepID=X7YJA0_MYCXE|nr:alpha-D-GlcNAc-pyrophosphate polyprenol, alpha-3-L-rhamnosyltransferase domain protein [Mycobacterium xenopi 4042]
MSDVLPVVTVTYSPGPHLERFLASLSLATDRPVSVLMADNGSTDGAPQAAVERYPNVRLFDTGGNLGYGTAVNRAMARLAEQAGAADEWVVVANPDVQWGPGSIDALLEAAARWPRAATLGPLIRDPDGAVYPSARHLPSLFRGGMHAIVGPVWRNNPWSTAYRQERLEPTERPVGWLSGRACWCAERRSSRSAGLTSGTSCISRTSILATGWPKPAGKTSTCRRLRCCTTKATSPVPIQPAALPPTTRAPIYSLPIGILVGGGLRCDGRCGPGWRRANACWCAVRGEDLQKGGGHSDTSRSGRGRPGRRQRHSAAPVDAVGAQADAADRRAAVADPPVVAGRCGRNRARHPGHLLPARGVRGRVRRRLQAGPADRIRHRGTSFGHGGPSPTSPRSCGTTP